MPEVVAWNQSPVSLCSTVELDIELEVPPHSCKDTLQYCLQLPKIIAHIQRHMPWIHFLAQLDEFYHQG